MKAFVFAILLLSISPVTHAFLGLGDLQFYECTSRASALTCGECRKSTKVSFQVNQERSVVMIQFNNSSASALDGCRVIDAKNWDCSRGVKPLAGLFRANDTFMRNGVYVGINETLNTNGAVIAGQYYCAK
jgi:hypothetical protein